MNTTLDIAISSFIEAVAAGISREQLRLGAGVFAAVKRAQPVDFADAQALLIGTEERAAIRQTATSTALPAGTFAVFVNRQNTCGRALEFGSQRIFREKFCSNVGHKYKS